MPKLELLVKATVEKMSDPEARGVAERAYNTLQKAAEGASDKVVVKQEEALKVLKECLGDKAEGEEASHVAGLAAAATNMRNFDAAAWKADVGPEDPFAGVIEGVRSKMEVASKPKEDIEEEDTEGVDLYKGAFSLAYGTLTLLRDAKMHLKRDRFYGLLGPNQCGKTTLMRAIARE